MSGPQILSIIHYVGWGFIFLWIMATGARQGMWNNALMFINWLLASFLALPISLPACGLIVAAVQPSPGDVYTPFAIWAGVFWLLFLVTFLIMQMITESLSKVKVTFHPVAETIGSLAFSFGVFLILAGVTLPLLAVVRAHGS